MIQRSSKYYYIWIEGWCPRYGEKVKQLTDTGFSYTTKITDSLRVKADDIPAVKDYMKRHGIAQWVIDSPTTFVATSYIPKGTLLDLNRVRI